VDSGACVWAGASAWHAGETGWADGARVGPAGRPAGPACWAHAGVGKGRVGLLLGWVLVVGLGLFSIFLSISIYSLISNLSQTKVEFKYEFEFKPQSIKSMHQHECNNKNLNL